MTRGARSWLSGGLIALATVVVSATAPAQQVPGTPHPPGAAAPAFSPTPSPTPSSVLPPQTSAAPATPAASATPAPAPGTSPGPAAPAAGAPAKGALIRFGGQLLDVRNGFVYFTTADAFKAAPAMRVIDLDSPGGNAPIAPRPRYFAHATLDPGTGDVTELALTRKRIPTDAAYQEAYAAAHAYAMTGVPLTAAPELRNQVRMTGRPVAVTFLVQVPPTTPISDAVYITTDASGWVANAMKMDRIDALHYRLTRVYASGTKFAYRYTRGSWNSVEVGEDGLQDDPHQFLVPEVDAKLLNNTVYRWSDQNPAQPQVGPDSIPTPFNPNPFGNLPSPIKNPGIPPASPTPRP